MARKTIGNDEITNENQLPTSPKYPKPQILLIDLEAKVEDTLKEKGYNVISGSFGERYAHSRMHPFPATRTEFFPNTFTESDIVVIDLLSDGQIQHFPEELKSIDVSLSISPDAIGIIDSRPLNMRAYRDDFNRILYHGGIFLVFAAPFQTITVQDRSMRGEKLNNYEFLHLGDMQYKVRYDTGESIEVLSSPTAFNDIFRFYTKDNASFSCTFSFQESEPWLPLAINKYNQCVSGILKPNSAKGFIFFLPNIRDTTGFLVQMLQEALPDIAPNLFPYAEKSTWIYSPQYELPDILEKQAEIKSIQQETENRISKISIQIEALRTKNKFLYQLLTETGDVLVQAVKEALEILGFTDIVNVDEVEKHVETQGRQLEDLRIENTDPILLIEVKGLSNKPTDEAALQVSKYLYPRSRDFRDHDLKGLSVINHQKHLPPLDREKAFNDVILMNAQSDEIGLLTTWNLFRLVRNYMQNKWTHDQVKDVFFESGEIDALPSHYTYCGVIERYIKDANIIGVEIEQGILAKGDTISLEFNVDFVEQPIESIEIDNKQVEQAQEGDLVGIEMTQRLPPEKTIGVKVYLVSNS